MIGDNPLMVARLTITKDVLMIERSDGWWWKLKIDSNNPNLMQGINCNGKKVTFERFK